MVCMLGLEGSVGKTVGCIPEDAVKACIAAFSAKISQAGSKKTSSLTVEAANKLFSTLLCV